MTRLKLIFLKRLMADLNIRFRINFSSIFQALVNLSSSAPPGIEEYFHSDLFRMLNNL